MYFVLLAGTFANWIGGCLYRDGGLSAVLLRTICTRRCLLQSIGGTCGADTRLCNDAPVYRQPGVSDGAVLYRYQSGSDTQWIISDGADVRQNGMAPLEDCHSAPYGQYYYGSANKPSPGGPPTDPEYGSANNGWGGIGWDDYHADPQCSANCGITVVSTDLGGEGR